MTPDAGFREMESEWLAITAFPLDECECAIDAMLREQDSLVVAREWVSGPKDLLTLVGRARWETYHSALLAWLLWPGGQHRLGDAMLRRMLERTVGIVAAQTRMRCRTATEVTGSTSRADIVIQGPGLKVVIEVKVDAQERQDQCLRLHSDHQAASTAFVFLTPDGRRPRTAGNSAPFWACLSFREVRDDLAACLSETAAVEGGAATARAYLETLRKEFP